MADRVMVSPRKWDKWYRLLNPSYKSMFDFLYTNPLGCTRAGIWDRDDETAKHWVNDKKLNLELFLKAANEDQERIKPLKGGKKWFVVDYIWSQNPAGLRRFDTHGNLNKVHSGIYAELEKYDIDPSFYEISDSRGSAEGLQRAKNKDKATDKDKAKDNVLEVGKKPFGEEGLVLLTQEEYEKLLVKLGERKTAEFISRLENYVGSKGKKYKSHYHTILSWTTNTSTTKSCEGENPLNLNKTQMQNMEALSDFLERKGKAGPENIHAGNSHPIRSLPGGKV